jgi:hypothetical protein
LDSSKEDGKLPKDFKQEGDLIRLMFLKKLFWLLRGRLNYKESIVVKRNDSGCNGNERENTFYIHRGDTNGF